MPNRTEMNAKLCEILFKDVTTLPPDKDLSNVKLSEIVQDLTNNFLDSKATEFLLGIIFGNSVVNSRLQQFVESNINVQDKKTKETLAAISFLNHIVALFSISSRLVIKDRRGKKGNWFVEGIRYIVTQWIYVGFCSPYREELASRNLIRTAYPYPIVLKTGIDGESLAYKDISPDNFKKLMLQMKKYLKNEPSEFLRGSYFLFSLGVSGFEFLRGKLFEDLPPSFTHCNISADVRKVHYWLLALLRATEETIKSRSKGMGWLKERFLKIFHAATEDAIVEVSESIKLNGDHPLKGTCQEEI